MYHLGHNLNGRATDFVVCLSSRSFTLPLRAPCRIGDSPCCGVEGRKEGVMLHSGSGGGAKHTEVERTSRHHHP